MDAKVKTQGGVRCRINRAGGSFYPRVRSAQQPQLHHCEYAIGVLSEAGEVTRIGGFSRNGLKGVGGERPCGLGECLLCTHSGGGQGTKAVTHDSSPSIDGLIGISSERKSFDNPTSLFITPHHLSLLFLRLFSGFSSRHPSQLRLRP
jgi:hypothetical protein